MTQFRDDEFFHGQLDSVLRSGHGEQEGIAAQSSHRTAEHCGRADLLVTEHAEEFAKAGQGFVDKAFDHFDGGVTPGDACATGGEDHLYVIIFDPCVEHAADGGHFITDQGTVDNVMACRFKQARHQVPAGVRVQSTCVADSKYRALCLYIFCLEAVFRGRHLVILALLSMTVRGQSCYRMKHPAGNRVVGMKQKTLLISIRRLVLTFVICTALSSLGLLLTGCSDGSMNTIDRQTSELIRNHWAQSIDREAAQAIYDKPVTDAPVDDSRNVTNTKLPTTNPGYQALPARTRTKTDPGELGKLFEDDMTNARQMDLQDILGYAIANSREYRRQKESLYITALSLLMEEHLWGPRFFEEVSATLSGTPESGDYDQALTVVNSFGVTHRLPNGGSVSATALVNFVNLLNDASNGSGEGQDASIELEASIPLLRGAGSVARESLIQARRDLIYASRAFERYRREYLLNISTRYYDLIRRQAELRNLQRQLKSLDWLSERITALAEKGRQPLFEIQRAQQQVLFARNSLINSQESYNAALDTLKLQIGMAIDQGLVVKPIELQIPEPFLEPNQAIATAWDFRLDLQTSRDRVDDAKRNVKNARNDLLPDLDVNASLTLSTDSNKTNAGVDFEAGDSDYSLGMTFGAPLDRRREQLQLRKDIIEQERAWRDYTQDRDQIALEVRQAIRKIQQARFTLSLQQRNIEVSTNRMRGVVLRLRTLGPRDFIEAQDDLLEAENTRDAALRDLRVSILQYLLSTGQLRVENNGQWKSPVNLVQMEIDPAAPTPDQMINDTKTTQDKILEEADEVLKKQN